LLGLFAQYFIFISPEMLAMGISNAAQSKLSFFPTAILKEWIQPIDTGEIFVVSFLLIGLFTLFHFNRTTFILIVCLLVFPPTIIYITCLLELVTAVPHARVFFYLQPIFILCVVIGVFSLTSRLRNSLRKLVGKIVLGFILLLVTIMSGKELLQVTWPDRFSR